MASAGNAPRASTTSPGGYSRRLLDCLLKTIENVKYPGERIVGPLGVLDLGIPQSLNLLLLGSHYRQCFFDLIDILAHPRKLLSVIFEACYRSSRVPDNAPNDNDEATCLKPQFDILGGARINYSL